MFNMGFEELILILLVAFIIVGPKDLPKVARAIGRAVRYIKAMFAEFKEETGLDEVMDELKETERDLKQTMKEADPRKEIKEAEADVRASLKEAEKSAKEGLESDNKG